MVFNRLSLQWMYTSRWCYSYKVHRKLNVPWHSPSHVLLVTYECTLICDEPPFDIKPSKHMPAQRKGLFAVS